MRTTLLILSSFLSLPAFATDYTADTSHSTVGFSVKHMMISTVRGKFPLFEAKVSYDPSAPQKTTIEANIDIAGVNTDNAKRDKHLQSLDFFNAAKHPQMLFKSTSAKATKHGLEVKGDLTIRGITKEVTLAVTDISQEIVDPWGNKRRAAVATTSITRSDFKLNWNKVLEAGGVMVSDEVKITLELELVEAK